MVYLLITETSVAVTYMSKLIYRFFDEAKSFWVSRKGNVSWPKQRNVVFFRLLLSGDLNRQRMKIGSQNQLLVPSKGNKTFSYGNKLGCCGRKQSGSYLDGDATLNGLMGLGLGDIFVPSMLAKAGLVLNSFSICFHENYSRRILFGDQGLATQQSTSFLPYNGK
ncbi:hypothetical protein F0562_032638 [Nyssa sinensis]|uniref:Xylanase inhibitor N-terminal domain-containing protein n=1 Tax=Nyssa sinensis TaxID=561372 RepID=A0A5J5ARS7_9ASTE|nr:hypothetical protein F0562_032638 [Nyssa sinensis]